MARGAKLGRAVGWAAGIGISNWLLQRRRAIPVKETRVQVSTPQAEEDVKAEVYRLRGETVSIGGMVELLIATLANRFALSKKKKPKAQWKVLKNYIKSAGLEQDLQAEIGRVNDYFRPRDLAAHAGMIISDVAETTRILRLDRDKENLRVDLVTLESLQEEVTVAQAGFDAVRAIGRALHDHQPEVLADMDDLTRAMLLDTT